MSPVILLLFFLSGAASLVYEVVWMRHLLLVFGTTSVAVTAVLTAFMGGLALGSHVLGRVGDRVRSPLRFYGLLEGGIGLYALAVPWLLDGLVPVYRWIGSWAPPGSPLLGLVRFVLAVAVLLVPTTLMGGTLPVVSRWAARRAEELGRRAGLLYAVNTWGAVAGVAGAGFWLLPALGMARTTWLAVTVTLCIGVIALALGRAKPASPHPAPSPSRGGGWGEGGGVEGDRTARLALGVFALSGFVALSCEVAWTRLLALIIGSSTYAFTVMLTAFLIGLAGGSLAASLLLKRVASPVLALAACQVGIGVTVFLGEFLFARLPLLFLALFQTVHLSPRALYPGMFLLSLGVMLPPTLLMGATFPLVLRIIGAASPTPHPRPLPNGGEGHLDVGSLVGRAYALNTLGTIGGAMATGLVLIPGLGIQRSLTLAAALAVAAGLVLVWTAAATPLAGAEWPHRRRAAGVIAAVLLVIPLAAPAWNSALMTLGVHKDAPVLLSLYRTPREVTKVLRGYRELFYREGRSATVSVREQPSLDPLPHLTLSIDGKVDASTAGDMATQVLSGHLPLLMTPRADRVLVIGFASGITAGAVLRHPVREVVAVEIEPAVVAASRLFDEFNHRPLADPRLRLVVEDARNYLLADPGGPFDLIISEPSNPWMSGPAKLFTEEFFRLGRARLAPDGLFVQWLQLYGIRPEHLQALVRTFRAVFPSVLIFQTGEGDLLLVGSAGPPQAGGRPHGLDLVGIGRRLSDRPGVRADLGRVRVRDAYDVAARLLLGPDEAAAFAGSGPLNTDDNALIEFAAPRSLYMDTVGINLGELRVASRGIAASLAWPGVTPASGGEERTEVLVTLADRLLSAPAPAAPRQISVEGLIEQAQGLTPAAPTAARPEQIDWLAGRLALSRGQEADAVAAWQAALRKDPTQPESLLALARLYEERAQWPEARAMYERLNPAPCPASSAAGGGTPAAPCGRYGIVLYHLGRYQEAVRALTAALAPSPSLPSPSPLEGEGRGEGEINRLGDRVEFRFYLAQAYDRLRRPAQAEAAREALLQDLEAWRVALERTPRAYPLLRFRRLLEFHQERGITVAEEAELDRLFTTHVADPLVHFYSGAGLYVLGYDEVAVRELEAALRGLPHDDPTSLIHLYLGLTLYRLGRHAEAMGPHTEAVSHLEPYFARRETQPPDYRQIEAGRVLAELYTAHGHPEEAEKVRAAGLDIRRRLFAP